MLGYCVLVYPAVIQTDRQGRPVNQVALSKLGKIFVHYYPLRSGNLVGEACHFPARNEASMRNSLVMDLLIALLYLRGTIWLW